MDLRQIRYFIAVAEELHFGRAAQRVGISQPPLSQQIQALERSVGTQLFERKKRRVSLTRAGEILLTESYRLLEQSDRARYLVKQAGNEDAGLLRIGVVTSALVQFLPHILKDIRASFPDCEPLVKEVTTTDALRLLSAGEIDVALARVGNAPLPPNVFSENIRTDLCAIALPAAHPLAKRTRLSLRELGNEKFIMFSRQSSRRFYDGAIAAFHKVGISPPIAHEVMSISSQIGLVACGLGICLVPPPVGRMQSSDQVVYIELSERIQMTDLAVGWSGKPSRLVTAFIDIARIQAQLPEAISIPSPA